MIVAVNPSDVLCVVSVYVCRQWL